MGASGGRGALWAALPAVPRAATTATAGLVTAQVRKENPSTLLCGARTTWSGWCLSDEVLRYALVHRYPIFEVEKAQPIRCEMKVRTILR